MYTPYTHRKAMYTPYTHREAYTRVNREAYREGYTRVWEAGRPLLTVILLFWEAERSLLMVIPCYSLLFLVYRLPRASLPPFHPFHCWT